MTTKQNEAKQNDAKQNEAKQNEAKQNDAKQNDAKQNDAKQNDAKQNDAKQNEAKQNEAKQNEAKTTTKSTGATKGGYRFRVHDDAIALCRLVRTIAALIERHDRKMAAQLRTATSAIALNTAEGAGRRGGHQRERLSTALWSSREVKANLEASEALGYLTASEVVSEAADTADKICATLWRCLHR